MNFIYSTRNAPGEPWIEKAPSIINQADGSVLLELLCNGNPQPEVKWILRTPKGDRELVGDGYAHKMKKQVGKYVCTMIIKKPKPDDQGTIKIVATNEHGTHSVEQNFMLKCTGKDIFKSVDSYLK